MGSPGAVSGVATQSSQEQRYVMTLITAAKETRGRGQLYKG